MGSDISLTAGSKVEITRLEFDQCSEFPCVVHHGETATGRAHMVANAATDTLTCKVKLMFAGGIVTTANTSMLSDCGYRGGRYRAAIQRLPHRRLREPERGGLQRGGGGGAGVRHVHPHPARVPHTRDRGQVDAEG